MKLSSQQFKWWFMFLGFFLISSLGFGQQVIVTPKDGLSIKPRPCEFNNLILEDANEAAGKNRPIILISRPGLRDTKSEVVERRLYTARAYLIDFTNYRTSENTITAIARNEGRLDYGGIEVYVGGKLLDVITSEPNQLLGVGPCDSPESDDKESRRRRALLYPWLYKTK
jgi:hypothetical protein